MLVIIILLSIFIIFLLTRLFVLKNEIKNLTKQLQAYNKRLTNKKMNMALLDTSLERLSTEINQLIDLHVMENRKRVQFETEQRQAVANMSHDLRTPLTSIIGYIQMAQSRDGGKKEREELLAIALKKAKRLETLLNDFFELSIIESPEYELKWEKVNMRRVLTETLISFYERFVKKGIEPILDIGEKDIFIHADRSSVNRVIENLLSNALKHGDGNIVVRLEEDRGKVRIVVINDAQSLTKEDIPRLFDRFYMADMSRSGKSGGLGLSIVKSLMDKMNGKIEASLENGQFSIICEWENGAVNGI